jgi:hypothetical protein
MTFDGKAFGAEIVGAVKEHVSSVLRPVLRRLDELEKRQPLQGERGADGAPGKDGRDGVDGKDGVDGRDGKDAEPITDEQIVEAVARYLTANPPASGKDGRDGKDGAPGRDGKDGAPGEKGADGRDGLNGKDGAPGRDGLGMAGAVINRDGNLVITMTDGTPRELGCVIGKDGAPGRDGKDGEPGRDGVGFDDLDLTETEEGVFLRFMRGDQVKSFRLPIVVDRGVWREGQYRKGDGVTWAGSFWIAQEDTTEKPDTGKGWRLAVKKGRDGK